MNTLSTNLREARLKLLTERAEKALQNRKNGYEQRRALDMMAVDAEYAGVALLDWLEIFFETRAANKTTLQQPISSAANSVLVCKGCDKQFATQNALNGHGEGRCMRNRAEEAKQ